MSDIKMTNIPSMNVGKTVEKLSNAYCTIIQNNYPIEMGIFTRRMIFDTLCPNIFLTLVKLNERLNSQKMIW